MVPPFRPFWVILSTGTHRRTEVAQGGYESRLRHSATVAGVISVSGS
jgi:hypothetical protein